MQDHPHLIDAAFVSYTFRMDPRVYLRADAYDKVILTAAHNVIARAMRSRGGGQTDD